MHHFFFFFLNCFLLNIGQQLNNLTSVFITLFVECLFEALKILHMYFINNKRPSKVELIVYKGKKHPIKARSRFYEGGIPVRWENLFSYQQVLIF